MDYTTQQELKQKMQNIVQESMSGVNLKPTNLNEEETEKFFRVYRVLTVNYMKYEEYVRTVENNKSNYEKELNGFKELYELLDNMDDLSENMYVVKQSVKKQIEHANYQQESQDENLKEEKETLKNMENFMDKFNKNILNLKENGECEISSELMFLVDYLHEFTNIEEQEEELLKLGTDERNQE